MKRDVSKKVEQKVKEYFLKKENDAKSNSNELRGNSDKSQAS